MICNIKKGGVELAITNSKLLFSQGEAGAQEYQYASFVPIKLLSFNINVSQKNENSFARTWNTGVWAHIYGTAFEDDDNWVELDSYSVAIGSGETKYYQRTITVTDTTLFDVFSYYAMDGGRIGKNAYIELTGKIEI